MPECGLWQPRAIIGAVSEFYRLLCDRPRGISESVRRDQGVPRVCDLLVGNAVVQCRIDLDLGPVDGRSPELELLVRRGVRTLP